ncbi:MAG: CehA/McbA family metallohydrolase [Thermoanaerobaculia bacterium]
MIQRSHHLPHRLRPDGRPGRILSALIGPLALLVATSVHAHGLAGSTTVTWSAAVAADTTEEGPRLAIEVLDDEGLPTAARLGFVLDGHPWIPPAVGAGGLRFTAVHQARKQSFTFVYALGREPVVVPLPARTRSGRVLVTKGYEFLPARADFTLADGRARVTVRLERWANSRAEGWVSADEHIHFDRTDPAHDADWLALLAGDDLDIGHFLLARGTNVPGLWGTQYAFGPAGEARDEARLVRPGEEFRDGDQGHVNLLGLEEVIHPISSGGLEGGTVWDDPPLHDVLTAAHRQGGLAGVAHGGLYGERPTAALDAVLGTADFFEIANTHLYRFDLWYRLLDCGWLLPPAAGTDLPNFPFRDWWQPLLGEVRMYARTGGATDFDSWRDAVERGEVWISSGPKIELSVDGVGPGGTVHLPADGGTVTVTATLTSPRQLLALEVVSDGIVVDRAPREHVEKPLHRMALRTQLHIEQSTWIAARGEGPPIPALTRWARLEIPALAHTAAVAVLVGDRPIRSPADAAALALQLQGDRDYYRLRGRFPGGGEARHLLAGFDEGLAVLRRREAVAPPASGRSRAPALTVLLIAVLAGLAVGWGAHRSRPGAAER